MRTAYDAGKVRGYRGAERRPYYDTDQSGQSAERDIADASAMSDERSFSVNGETPTEGPTVRY